MNGALKELTELIEDMQDYAGDMRANCLRCFELIRILRLALRNRGIDASGEELDTDEA